jgi:hypothetical protein
MNRTAWTVRDPLFRGDEASGVAVPSPSSKRSIVEHILYLGGRGRETPFTSTTESPEVATWFSGEEGLVWETTARQASSEGARHLSRKDLLHSLRGFGKGKAKWSDAFEVAQAARYVEEWSEHLFDWSTLSQARIGDAIRKTFRKRSR